MSDPIKEKLERLTLGQAGRVDFFKQSLTLSLAGVAGCAALFTGGEGLPRSSVSMIAAVLAALLLLSTAAWSLMGLSTYANLLGAIAKGRDPTKFEDGMISHARGAFILLALTALAITFYAGSRLSEPSKKDETVPAMLLPDQPAMTLRSAKCPTNIVMLDSAASSLMLCMDDASLAKYRAAFAAHRRTAAPVKKPLPAAAWPHPAP